MEHSKGTELRRDWRRIAKRLQLQRTFHAQCYMSGVIFEGMLRVDDFAKFARCYRPWRSLGEATILDIDAPMVFLLCSSARSYNTIASFVECSHNVLFGDTGRKIFEDVTVETDNRVAMLARSMLFEEQIVSSVSEELGDSMPEGVVTLFVEIAQCCKLVVAMSAPILGYLDSSCEQCLQLLPDEGGELDGEVSDSVREFVLAFWVGDQWKSFFQQYAFKDTGEDACVQGFWALRRQFQGMGGIIQPLLQEATNKLEAWAREVRDPIGLALVIDLVVAFLRKLFGPAPVLQAARFDYEANNVLILVARAVALGSPLEPEYIQ